MEVNYRIFEKLIYENTSFALYKFPNENTIHFVRQDARSSKRIKNISEIGNQSGFVICPFAPSASAPVILIRPDIYLKGQTQIERYIHQNFPEPKIIKKERNNASPLINDFEIYKKTFQTFLAALKNKTLEKAVLSRFSEYAIGKNFSITQTFYRAVEKYPSAFVYLCRTPQSGAWFGCSPELLLSAKNGQWQTVALAGTKKAGKKVPEWDEKNLREQEIVSKYIRQQLENRNIDFAESKVQSAVAGNVVHLKTEFVFQLSSPNKMGNLLQALHPTPAVCGFPKEKALDFILANEGYDRRYYTGFAGVVNMENITSLHVNLRCMELLENSLKLYAGGGLLATSDVETEWRETEYKLQTLLSIIKN